MQDRVSNHPGRWLLTPVAGQTNVYDFTRADDPTVIGTELNKANLLTDATAAAIGALSGTTPETPNEALGGLGGVLDTMGIANNAKLEIVTYTGAGGGYSQNYNSLTFSIKPRIVFWTLADLNNPWTEYGVYGMVWFKPNTRGPIWHSNQYSAYIIFDFVENTKTLRWRVHCPGSTSGWTTNEYSAMNMESSGKTYTVYAIGVK